MYSGEVLELIVKVALTWDILTLVTTGIQCSSSAFHNVENYKPLVKSTGEQCDTEKIDCELHKHRLMDDLIH